jgi:hypothetical protein
MRGSGYLTISSWFETHRFAMLLTMRVEIGGYWIPDRPCGPSGMTFEIVMPALVAGISRRNAGPMNSRGPGQARP